MKYTTWGVFIENQSETVSDLMHVTTVPMERDDKRVDKAVEKELLRRFGSTWKVKLVLPVDETITIVDAETGKPVQYDVEVTGGDDAGV